jgi:hypothetical protein
LLKFSSVFWRAPMLLVALVFCVVLLCVFMLVSCWGVCYDFRVNTMFNSFLPLVVGRMGCLGILMSNILSYHMFLWFECVVMSLQFLHIKTMFDSSLSPIVCSYIIYVRLICVKQVLTILVTRALPLVFHISPLSTQQSVVRTKTCWFGVKVKTTCLQWAIYLSCGCFVVNEFY